MKLLSTTKTATKAALELYHDPQLITPYIIRYKPKKGQTQWYRYTQEDAAHARIIELFERDRNAAITEERIKE